MAETAIVGTALENIPCGAAVEQLIYPATGATAVRAYRKPSEDSTTPEHVKLTQEAVEAGLIVTQLMPAHRARDSYAIQFWSPEGTLWAEGSGETAAAIRWHINNWRKRR